MTTIPEKTEMQHTDEELGGGNEVEEPQDTTSTPIRVFAKSPADVLRCKFVVAQILFNVVASFLCPLGTFYLLFGLLSQGPYVWSSGACVGVVVGSLACSPLLIFALMPVGMPEAVQKGWFLPLRLEKCSPWLLRVLFYLDDAPRWRWASARHLALGLMLGIVYVPIALLIARFALGPTLSTWTLIWFNVAYVVLLSIPVTALGLLGYAVEHNLDFTLSRMSSNPNIAKRLLFRSLSCLKMIVWPY
jgi:hypothetical protein